MKSLYMVLPLMVGLAARPRRKRRAETPDERRDVYRLQKYWCDENARRRNPRNTPCACASGRKVKHCHGTEPHVDWFKLEEL